MTKRINLRKLALAWGLVTMIGLSFTACNDDDTVKYPTVDGANPTLTLTPEHIQTEAGRVFTISGVVKDADGLKSITLKNSELFLDKTINLLDIYRDSLLYEYNLSYKYTANADWTTDQEFNVDITVEDVLGHTTSATVKITPDGDFTNPVFSPVPSASLTVLLQSPTLNLNTVVSDNRSLDYVKYTIEGVTSDSIALDGATSYTLKKSITFPAEAATYPMTIVAADKAGNTVTAQSTIHVSEMPDFAKMYLVDITDEADLTSDLYGVPMLIEHTGAYQYRARYYNQKAGTQVRFVPQKTSFAPICFGLDPSNSNALISDPETSQPIVLNEVAYYEIDFNSVSGEYSVKTYVPTDTPFPQGEEFVENGVTQKYELSLAGSGLPGVGNWSTSDPFILTQDAKNKYLFYGEMTLTAGTEIEFTITPKSASGWWPSPFWRFEKGENDSGENEYNTPNDGNNMSKVTVSKAGKYRFEFDTHLCRSRFYPIN